jgi:CheY-like chemotaxis protein
MSLPPETYAEQVKQALEHLQDFPFLNRHPLAKAFPPAAGRVQETDGQRLRRGLMEAIEALNPGQEVFYRSYPARFYHLIKLHYVESMIMQDVAQELGVSERQAFRDLRRAEEAVAAILWERVQGQPQPPPLPPPLPPPAGAAREKAELKDEISALETHFQSIDLRTLVQSARKAVERLAAQAGLSIELSLPEEPLLLFTDFDVAQQVIISLFSRVVQNAQPPRLATRLDQHAKQKMLEFCYRPGPSAASAGEIQAVVRQFAQRLGWSIRQERLPSGEERLQLILDTQDALLLVVDNNEALAELLTRYLSGEAIQVISAATGQEGLRLAQTMHPEAVVLDVMMPEMDGWEVLQRLQTNPETADIPVIVCSIFNDPPLAYSLGARYYLPKPVPREAFRAILQQLNLL